MSKSTVQNLLKKINYIETDLDIHRQILLAIPSANIKEMEDTIKLIAEKQAEIKRLLEQIKALDPGEYDRILAFEQATSTFRRLAQEKNFVAIGARSNDQECSLELLDGTSVDCLIKACDTNGDWTIIDPKGELRTYVKSLVAEKVPIN
jgi:Na+-transporting NADH:ubiquinone oxidoreductase subunit NqrC